MITQGIRRGGRAIASVDGAGRRRVGRHLEWRRVIVTNAHVVHESTVKVSLWDGSAHEARLLNRDARRDLASLKIEADGLSGAEPGDSGALRVGELVMAVGNPFGFNRRTDDGRGPLDAESEAVGRGRCPGSAPGNSGGPLADARGRVIGINTMIAGGLALAGPSNAVGEFLARRGASGPKLGVTLQPVAMQGGALGFLLLKIDPGSAAESASLMVGDLLIAADGRAFTSADDLGAALDSSGEVMELQFLRGDRRVTRETAIRLPRAVAGGGVIRVLTTVGLESLVRSAPMLELVGSEADLPGLAVAVERMRPDVVLIEGEFQPDESLPEAAVVLLAAEPAGRGLQTRFARGFGRCCRARRRPVRLSRQSKRPRRDSSRYMPPI